MQLQQSPAYCAMCSSRWRWIYCAEEPQGNYGKVKLTGAQIGTGPVQINRGHVASLVTCHVLWFWKVHRQLHAWSD